LIVVCLEAKMKRLPCGAVVLAGLASGAWACTAEPDMGLGSETAETGGRSSTGGDGSGNGAATGGTDRGTGGAESTGGRPVRSACEGVPYEPGNSGEGPATAWYSKWRRSPPTCSS
jgi:hypothetical protein